jgi:hypothetical protein
MNLELFDGKYRVRFQHDTVDKWTTATLVKLAENKDQNEIVHVAEAHCHWKDIFSRKTGRKIALARLLEWMSNNRFNLTREDRAKIWKQYFTEFKNGK